MALIHTSLGPVQYVPTTAGSIYTNPAATKTYVRGLWIFNANASASETVKVYNVAAIGGTVAAAGTNNQILEVSVTAKQAFSIEFPGPGFVLPNQNDSVQAVTSTGTHVTVMLIGDYDQ
jgi:hypothetical protein